MRYREPFIVFPRKLQSGRKVYYFQTYDEYGRRTNPKSTGKTNKAAAQHYCMMLWKNDELVESKQTPTFKAYTIDWFEYDRCPYIQAKLKRGGKHSKRFAKNQRAWLTVYLWSKFGKKRIDEITPKFIENWLHGLKETSGLTNSSLNHYYATLRLVMNEAERLGDIDKSPCHAVKPLVAEKREKGILSDKEVKALFKDGALETVWQGNRIYQLISYLSACTGLRLGECQGLQWEDVFEDHLHICHSYEKTFKELKGTKTGVVRDIPISPYLYKQLLELKMELGIQSGFVFSLDGGNVSVYDTTIRKWLKIALERVGVTKQAQKERNLSFHSWRHLTNTRLIEMGVPAEVVKVWMGHANGGMTGHYGHHDLMLLNHEKIHNFQESIRGAA